ncbi:hypothetical protein B0H19DRAFT_370535 [Mycena capillaripes]|nr:hypothetical protein B0H19DRAFT_370535 [Mycena capillaripes]
MSSQIRVILALANRPELGAENRTVLLVLRFLNDSRRECSLSVRSLQIFGCFRRPNIHLGLVLYDELCDITYYWDSLTPVEKAISKHRFFLDYIGATAFPILDAIFWIGGRSSHVVFPRPSPPTSMLLTLVNAQGRLQISIVPDSESPIHYPHIPYTESVNRDTLSWLEFEFRRPTANIAPPILRSMAFAVYRTVMVASASGTIRSRKPEAANVLGELVVQNSERAFWDSEVQFRYYFPVSSADKSYKWRWHDNTTTDIYHGIPGWTRFALHRNKDIFARLSSIDIGDNGDNVDDWTVLLSAIMNWTQAPADLRAFCSERCTLSTQVGFSRRS